MTADKSQTIILIGPMCAGKSTLAQLLAEALSLPHHSLDDERWAYYNEVGYDEALASAIRKSEGILGLLRYWKPFEAHAVERMLTDYSGVIDFGVGHTVHEDETLFLRVQRALKPHPKVILILPSADLEESVVVVNARFAKMMNEEGREIDADLLKMNELFVKHPSDHRLAKLTVYTEGKSSRQTCDEILRALDL